MLILGAMIKGRDNVHKQVGFISLKEAIYDKFGQSDKVENETTCLRLSSCMNDVGG